ncbi:MAG: ArsR/SmtB family transcription factor [Acidimicrobiia bacterium]
MHATLDRTFAALGDPARRSIVRHLAGGSTTVGRLAEPFDISRPAISKHLRVLSDAGIVEHQKDGREHWYSLSAGAFEEVEAWMDEIESTWARALTSLKQIAEEAENDSRE